MIIRKKWVAWEEFEAILGGATFAPSIDINAGQVGGLSKGSIPFADDEGFLTEDNSNLFWDAANIRLGIGTATPDCVFDIEFPAVESVVSRVSAKTRPWRHWECIDGNWGLAVGINADDGIIHFNYDSPIGTKVTSMMVFDGPNARVGILDNTPSYPLDVGGNTQIQGTLRVTAATTLLGALDVTGLLSNTGGAKLEVQGGVDGGSTRGIFLWDTASTSWGIYMSQSGAGKSLGDGAACTDFAGSTEYHFRFRIADTSINAFVWENSSEACLMDLAADTGDLSILGILDVRSGSIISNSGAISFGDENLSTSGTLGSGKLTVNAGVGQAIIIKGTSTGNANLGWIGFYDSDGTTRRGWVGDASATNDDIVLGADTGDLHLRSVSGNVLIGTLILADGSITDSGGAISFGNENLTTTGIIKTAQYYQSANLTTYFQGNNGVINNAVTFYRFGDAINSITLEIDRVGTEHCKILGGSDLILEASAGTFLLRTGTTNRFRIWATGGTSIGSTYSGEDPGTNNFLMENNVAIGTLVWGTNATKTLALGAGVAPTTSPADMFQMYSADFAAGNACPYFRTENGTIIGLNQSLLTTDSPTFISLVLANSSITDDGRGLSSIHTLAANPAKSDGIGFYSEGHIGAITTDGPTYGAGIWLNIDPGATLGGDVRALDIGIYEADADCSGGNAYGLAIHMEFDDTDPPAGIYAFRINCNDTPGHATPAALIFAPNKKAIGLVTGDPGTPDDAYLKIVMQGGDVYRIPLVKE